jgi:hypothetical protein
VEGNIEEHGIASASRALRGLRALACAYTPCTGTGRSPDWPSWWSAQGRCNTDACDARLGEVRHQHSTEEAREQCATTGSGAGGGKGGDQGEPAATSHVPDAEPGARVPGVDACTASQPWSHPRWSKAACRHLPKVGAGWGSTSRPDLRRGCRVTGIPTAIERLTTRTDGSRLLCFLPHSPGHLCYDERVVYPWRCSFSLHCVHTNRCMRSINSIGTLPSKDHP